MEEKLQVTNSKYYSTISIKNQENFLVLKIFPRFLLWFLGHNKMCLQEKTVFRGPKINHSYNPFGSLNMKMMFL